MLPLNDVSTPPNEFISSSSEAYGSNSSLFSFSPPPPIEKLSCRTLLDEIREVLAQSYLIFLMADLRLMSGTGRICTKYENLAIDSDVYPRNSAAQLACLVLPRSEHQRLGQEEEMEEDSAFFYNNSNAGNNIKIKPNMVARGPEQPTKSLSPASIMAILLLEIRDTVVSAIGKSDEATSEVEKALMTYREDKVKWRNLEDSMTSLLRAYARMISEDLVTEIPNVVRRRRRSVTPNIGMSLFPSPQNIGNVSEALDPHGSANNRLSDGQPNSSLGLASIREETNGDLTERKKTQVDQTRFRKKIDKEKDGENDSKSRSESSARGSIDKDKLARKSEPSKEISDEAAPEGEIQKEESEQTIPGGDVAAATKKKQLVNSTTNLFSPARRQQLARQVSQKKLQITKEAKQLAANLNKKRQSVVNEINDIVDPNWEGNAQKEFVELTNALFEQNEESKEVYASLGRKFVPGEMLTVMRSAVETRNDEQLQFLSRIFNEGSLSQLLVQSHSRLVWMNDWYPLKDLTYAIAVDTSLKRVLVVFRGAITTQDWRTVTKYTMETIPNPVKDNYEGKKERIRVFYGIHQYLFRVRKDTQTTKYSEIASLAHMYGIEKIGEDYKLFVTGHSLGGALTNMFSFFASTEDRFTRNGPVQAIAFAGPYCGGHSFADSFRHQERMKKLQFIRVANDSDMVPRLPINLKIGRRGCLWRHVGIGVTMPKVGWFRKWKPLMHYYGKEKSWFRSTFHGYRRNFIFHTPWVRPWAISRMHTLFELQDRLMYGEKLRNPGGDFTLLNQTLDELYDGLEEMDFEKLKGIKTKQW